MLSAGWHDIRFENDRPDLQSLSCDIFMTDETCNQLMGRSVKELAIC